jgi:hypothetical protein
VDLSCSKTIGAEMLPFTRPSSAPDVSTLRRTEDGSPRVTSGLLQTPFSFSADINTELIKGDKTFWEHMLLTFKRILIVFSNAACISMFYMLALLFCEIMIVFVCYISLHRTQSNIGFRRTCRTHILPPSQGLGCDFSSAII